MLLGLLLPSAGSITIFGENMLTHRHRVLPRLNFSSPYVDCRIVSRYGRT